MKLTVVRDSIKGKLQAGRPTMDFSYPDAVIDHEIFSAAEKIILEKELITGKQDVSPTQLTDYICLPIVVNDDECQTPNHKYYINLPFEVMEFPRDMGIYSVQFANNGKLVHHILPGQVRGMAEIPHGISEHNPHSFRVNNRLYVVAPPRDLSNTVFRVSALVGRTLTEEEAEAQGLTLSNLCKDSDLSVPIPGGHIKEVEDMVYNTIAPTLGIPVDLVQDGN